MDATPMELRQEKDERCLGERISMMGGIEVLFLFISFFERRKTMIAINQTGTVRLMQNLRTRKISSTRVYLSLPIAVVAGGLALHADFSLTRAEYQNDPARMIEAFRHVEAASVSDAEEQLLHERHDRSHRMQSIFPTKFAGTALTVLLKRKKTGILPGFLAC